MVTLVLGGARSGKSEVAERLAARAGGPVTYLATYSPPACLSDDDMAGRVEAHRRRRPPEWTTVEAGLGLPAALDAVAGPALVDSLGTWVAAHEDFAVDTAALCGALARRRDPTVVVSEEVGMGVHPSTESGRLFRDALGALNTAVATVAGQVMLVVAGRVLPLEPPG
ncbi:MAG TPA: bifunctional adenosylcobinamide kinase/adenosylcobinamide-phosphate guanylyltransferase [Acidimicrobiales bacterium]|nr:bifunctional adenosylcobinamide kinase/adenosylcobinamide-phosphate guanylyltransferase [Acidimicrobiales bacterium]